MTIDRLSYKWPADKMDSSALVEQEESRMTIVQLQVPIAQPLRQQVVDILRDAITSCLFEPGGKLTERVLCERLGVSRGTLREGLRQLEAEGLVRIVPNRGPMVTALTETEASECYALRAFLESEASAI